MGAMRHRRAAAALSAALLLLSVAVLPVWARPGEKGGQISWIVTLMPGADATMQGPELARASGGSIGHIYELALNGFQFTGSEAAADALRHDPNVRGVFRDNAVSLTETLPYGVKRIDAYVSGTPGGAYQSGYRGATARIAILDTGIDLDHPDLAASIDLASGKNCVDTLLPPNDGYGHGTHVAGSAAAPLNGVGVVGVAPQATLVPVKVFDDAGGSSEARVLCGLEQVIALNSDGDATNDVDVVSMSFGESRAWGDCLSEPLHEAICRASATGTVLVAGAGNSAADAGTFVPAAFPEVIGVSALADFDGQPGGLAGCGLVPDLGWYECDDTSAFFSNYGASVDVMAPGVAIYSTWKDGTYKTSSGTSMATPHVSGVVALMKAVNHGLGGADVLAMLRQSGECPGGTWADADSIPGCDGQGQWTDDRDGIAEPLVNALRAAQVAAGWVPPPPEPPAAPALAATAGDGQVGLSWVAPADGGSPITNYVVYRGTAPGEESDLVTLDSVVSYLDTAVSNDTTYYYQVAAVNAVGTGPRSPEVSATPTIAPPTPSPTPTPTPTPTATPTPTPSPTPTPTPTPTPVGGWDVAPQGDWVGVYGADGYALLAWNKTSDEVAMPLNSLVLDQGNRYRFTASTTSVRALENAAQTTRRAAHWSHKTSVQLHLTFPNAYGGTLHLYAIDWDGVTRRETITVDDGSGPQTVSLNASYHDGAWLHFTINVPAGGAVTIRADTSHGSASLSGIFLGGTGTVPTATPSPTPTMTPTATPTPTPSPTPTPTPTPTPVGGWDVAPQGDWVGNFGADGYALMAWNGSSGGDLVNMPIASLVLDQGTRFRWSSGTTSIRALEDETQTTRRAAQWVHATSLRLHLTFAAAYSGTLHLYALDWDSSSRREIVYLDDGSGSRSVNLNASYHDGAWLHFSIDVPAGGTVTIRADRTGGSNATLSGLFLGGGS